MKKKIAKASPSQKKSVKKKVVKTKKRIGKTPKEFNTKPVRYAVYEVDAHTGAVGFKAKFSVGQRVYVKALQLLPTVYTIKGIYIGRLNQNHVIRYHLNPGMYYGEEDLEDAKQVETEEYPFSTPTE